MKKLSKEEIKQILSDLWESCRNGRDFESSVRPIVYLFYIIQQEENKENKEEK